LQNKCNERQENNHLFIIFAVERHLKFSQDLSSYHIHDYHYLRRSIITIKIVIFL